MILAAVSERFLQDATASAALPEEDCLVDEREILAALRFGFPRLLVYSREEQSSLVQSAAMLIPGLPTVALTRPMLSDWDRSWRNAGGGTSRTEDAGRRLAALGQLSSRPPRWVEDVFRHLSNATGGPLPTAFRGFSRRILEFPRRYPDLHSVADLTGCSRDALKARFRRRDLPSPSRYLRWLRTMAVAYALGEDGATTASVAYRFGYSSGGNLCRSVQGLVDHTTLELRENIARNRLMLRFAAELLDSDQLAGWRVLDDLFVRRAA